MAKQYWSRREVLGAAVTAPLLLAPLPVLADAGRFTYHQVHMGMLARISLYAGSEAEAKTAARAAFRRIADLDNALSDYRDSSESARLAAAPGSPRVVSNDLLAVLLRARDLYRASDGLFDVTLGPLTRLRKECLRTRELPTGLDLGKAQQRCGWRHLRIDEPRNSVELLADNMILDFGAIGKGFAAQEAIGALRSAGIDSALVEIGGDIALGSSPPGTSGWRIKLPHAGDRILALYDVTVSTSGPEYQQASISGEQLTHFVNNRSVNGTATVVADDGASADALATCSAILGPGQGRAIAEKLGMAARIIGA